MKNAYWKNRVLFFEVITTLTFGLALIFTARDWVFLKWPVEGVPLPARLAFRGLPFLLISVFIIWIYRLQQKELNHWGIADSHLYDPARVTGDLQTLALIARVNARNPKPELVRAFGRCSDVWLNRYGKALNRRFGFLQMRMKIRVDHQIFLLKERFLDLHFGMISLGNDGRREAAEFLSSFHKDLRLGFGIQTQGKDSKVTAFEFFRMDVAVRVLLLAAITILVWKPVLREPAMYFAVALLVLFGDTTILEKARESVLEKLNPLK